MAGVKVDYKKRLYDCYISSHTSRLHGEATLSSIKRQFPVWKSYYGRFLPEDAASKILDLGCGYGGVVWWLQQLGYKDAHGIDISGEQIEKAAGLGIRNVEHGDIADSLKDTREFYDVIMARDVLEHFDKCEILTILDLIFLALKKDGLLILKVPNGESPFGGRYRYGDFTHEIAFTRASLSQILRAIGFTDVVFRPEGPVPKDFFSFIRFILWKIIETILRSYLLAETGCGSGIFTQNVIAVARK